MPFSYRVFCRDITSPSLSDVVLWMRQFESPVTIVGGPSAGDLLSSFWHEVVLAYGDDEPNLTLRCVRADAAGMASLRAEREDFLADLSELVGTLDGSARERVREQLQATRSLVAIEFDPDGVTFQAQEAARGLMALFVERASGMAQRDGIGFFDEDDDVLLKLG
jgi:hypothetical protein